MRLELSNCSKCKGFVHIFKNINKVSNFVLLHFKKDELKVQGLDMTKSAIFRLILKDTWFDEYNVESDELRLGISTNILSKILSIYNDKHRIIITHDDKSDYLYINYESETDFTKEFEIPLTDVDEDEIQITEFEGDVEFIIESKILSNIIDELKIFDDSLQIACNESKIILETSGFEGKMKCTLYDEEQTVDLIQEYSCVEGLDLQESYSLKFFVVFCSFDKVSSEIKLSFSEEKPMQMTYDLGCNSLLSFYLAPKITNDD